MKTFGIDISRWQGNFNLKAAMEEGVKFAVIKGGGGDDGLYTDSKFARNYTEAKKLGLPVGVYWFSKALTLTDAEKEAKYFINNCLKGRQFELPVYIDVEHSEQFSLGKKELTDIIIRWLEIVEAAGYWVGIYSSTYYFSRNIEDARLQNYAHWCAEWSARCNYKGNDGVLGMWQFGGETNVIRSNKVAGQVCDQNYMLVDYPAKIKAAGLNGFGKTAVKPVKTVEEIAKEVIRGKWGNGQERKKRLTEAGYDYAAVQKKVNELMK